MSIDHPFALCSQDQFEFVWEAIAGRTVPAWTWTGHEHLVRHYILFFTNHPARLGRAADPTRSGSLQQLLFFSPLGYSTGNGISAPQTLVSLLACPVRDWMENALVCPCMSRETKAEHCHLLVLESSWHLDTPPPPIRVSLEPLPPGSCASVTSLCTLTIPAMPASIPSAISIKLLSNTTATSFPDVAEGGGSRTGGKAKSLRRFDARASILSPGAGARVHVGRLDNGGGANVAWARLALGQGGVCGGTCGVGVTRPSSRRRAQKSASTSGLSTDARRSDVKSESKLRVGRSECPRQSWRSTSESP